MAAPKGQTFMALAVVLGMAAAFAAYFSITAIANQAAKTNSQNFKPVVVTAADLTFGVKLEPSMLKTVNYPKESVPAGAFSSIDSVVGQTTKVFMSAREPVTETKMSSRGGGLSMLVRPTMRAASIEVNQVSGVSGFVLPGDRVDVLVTIDPRGGMGEEAVTQTILQNIEVLAAGQKTQQQDNKPITVQAVTLLVDPSGAEQLAHARHEGELTLALRNPEDQEQAVVASFNTRQMMGASPLRSAPAAHRGTGRATAPAPARAASPTMQRKEDSKVRIIRSAAVTETPAVSDSVKPQ
jgi:pilus assembly protein CpaB